MGIKIRETFEIVTPESAENGESDSRGFIDEEGTEYSPRALAEILECTENSGNDWATCYDYRTDYKTGAIESRSYHPITKRDARYFGKVWKIANKNR